MACLGVLLLLSSLVSFTLLFSHGESSAYIWYFSEIIALGSLHLTLVLFLFLARLGLVFLPFGNGNGARLFCFLSFLSLGSFLSPCTLWSGYHGVD